MDIDPMAAVEDDDEDAGRELTGGKQDTADHHEKRKSRLNNWVALTIAILATFMGICKVKDDNIVQAMQQEQANKLDNWSYYQARNVREEIANSTAVQLHLQSYAAPPAAKAEYQKQIAAFQSLAKEQHEKKDQVKKDAEANDANYNRFNFHDDQFDLSDAMLALAISLLAVTSLTQKRWLFGVAMVPTCLGVLMGIAGLFNLNIHSDYFAKLLGT